MTTSWQTWWWSWTWSNIRLQQEAPQMRPGPNQLELRESHPHKRWHVVPLVEPPHSSVSSHVSSPRAVWGYMLLLSRGATRGVGDRSPPWTSSVCVRFFFFFSVINRTAHRHSAACRTVRCMRTCKNMIINVSLQLLQNSKINVCSTLHRLNKIYRD